MSDEIEDKPAKSEAPAAKVAKKRPAVRKSSKPAAKAAAEAPSAPAAESAPAPAPAPSSPAPERERERERDRDHDRGERDRDRDRERGPRDEPASPPPFSGNSERGSDSSDGGRIAFLVETPAGEPGGGSKKRRRRKKKHGQQPGGSQHPHAVAPPSEAPPAISSSPSRSSSEEPQPQSQAQSAPAPAMHAAPRPKLDPEQVAQKAWKIFQSEVGEEGLALIDDHDAREISRRCFRLAEIFLEEAARRTGGPR